MTFLIKYWLTVLLFILALVTMFALGSGRARAQGAEAEMDHSLHNKSHWYDAGCCHEKDCAPVLEFKQLPNGEEWARTKHGNVIITHDFPVTKRRESKDHQVHVCMRTPYGFETIDAKYKHKITTGYIAICIYYPNGS